MSVLVLVTARGGSKRLPGKNLKCLGGLSLIAWTARVAGAALPACRAVLSTDCEEIAAEGRRCGLEVPFLRPAELARDDSTSVDVVLHALDRIETETGAPLDAVVLLQPTSPFRAPELVRRCAAHAAGGADAISVKRLHVSLGHVYREDGDRLGAPAGRTGEAALVPTGAVYAVRTEALRLGRSMIPPGCLYEEHAGLSTLDIDTPDDWALALAAVAAGHAAPPDLIRRTDRDAQ